MCIGKRRAIIVLWIILLFLGGVKIRKPFMLLASLRNLAPTFKLPNVHDWLVPKFLSENARLDFSNANDFFQQFIMQMLFAKFILQFYNSLGSSDSGSPRFAYLVCVSSSLRQAGFLRCFVPG